MLSVDTGLLQRVTSQMWLFIPLFYGGISTSEVTEHQPRCGRMVMDTNNLFQQYWLTFLILGKHKRKIILEL
jgi:hypothetical protein